MHDLRAMNLRSAFSGESMASVRDPFVLTRRAFIHVCAG